VLSGALLRLRRHNEDDKLLPSRCELTVRIKRSGTPSLVVILAVDHRFNGSGFIKPVDRMRRQHGLGSRNLWTYSTEFLTEK
jgi:hypothetical protein